jgi:hypothetical protein
MLYCGLNRSVGVIIEFYFIFFRFPIQYYMLLALCSNFSKLYSIEVQYKSSITAQVGGSDFSALGNAKYVKICLVVRLGHL